MPEPFGEPDEKLIPRALAGNREAWELLIRRHERRVLLMLLAQGVRVDRARDITQETWARLIAHQRAGALERLELPGLAMRQATFLAMDDARRTKRGGARETREELAFLVDPAPSIEQRLVSRSQLERASAELDRCSPRARRVFELVYENPAMTHAATARLAGISVDRLRHTICEVRARLRAALEDDKISLAFARTRRQEPSDD